MVWNYRSTILRTATIATFLAIGTELALAQPSASSRSMNPGPATAIEPKPVEDADATAAPGVSSPAARPEVVHVVGHKLEESLPSELGRYGTRIDVVTADQIQNAGQPDVAKSLEKLAPGLYISPKNGAFDYVDISFQGSRTEDVLWLLDGVRLNNRLYAGTTPLDTFPASIVERLEIVEGPQALFYGTQAVAGAINIVTRSFSDWPEGTLALGADTTGGLHLDGSLRTAVGEHRFVVYGSGDRSPGFQPFRDQDYQPSATPRGRAYDVLTLGAKYAYDIRHDLRISALYQHTGAKLDFAKPFLVATAYNERDEDVATAKLEYSPRASTQVFVKGYTHQWRSHYTEFDNAPGAVGSLKLVDNRDAWGFQDYGANVMAKLAVARWVDSFFGYDFQSYDGSDAVLVITKRSGQVNAVFGEIRTPDGLERVRLAAGVRYNMPSVGESALVWSTTGQYKLADSLVVRATVGTSFRLPTAEELFANDPNDERGNPNLRPEKSFNMNVSIGGRARFGAGRGLSWEAIGFFRRVTDLIAASGFDPATNQSLFENLPGTVRVRGGTLAFDVQIAPDWSGSANTTVAIAEQDDGLQIDKVPRQQVKAWLDWHPTALPLGATVIANYVGNVYQSFGAADREHVEGRAIFDVAARVFLDEERRHKINVSLSNVFDAVYASSLAKGVRDADGSSYTYWNLGTPRTLAARYSYRF